jgi:hypothetical protein
MLRWLDIWTARALHVNEMSWRDLGGPLCAVNFAFLLLRYPDTNQFFDAVVVLSVDLSTRNRLSLALSLRPM